MKLTRLDCMGSAWQNGQEKGHKGTTKGVSKFSSFDPRKDDGIISEFAATERGTLCLGQAVLSRDMKSQGGSSNSKSK